MTDPVPTAPAATLGDLSGRLADDLLKLDGELSEVDQLITQAKSEATRHEASTRRRRREVRGARPER